MFSVILGEIDPLNLAFDGQYWLEIAVGAMTLAPRKKLSSSVYAFRAAYAEIISNAASSIDAS